jgi:hypothetical protein
MPSERCARQRPCTRATPPSRRPRREANRKLRRTAPNARSLVPLEFVFLGGAVLGAIPYITMGLVCPLLHLSAVRLPSVERPCSYQPMTGDAARSANRLLPLSAIREFTS